RATVLNSSIHPVSLSWPPQYAVATPSLPLMMALQVVAVFNAVPTPGNYTLSLHDALPILQPAPGQREDAEHDEAHVRDGRVRDQDRKSTRLNSSHVKISYAVFCLKKKRRGHIPTTAPRAGQWHGASQTRGQRSS